jgi:hypothetical protein
MIEKGAVFPMFYLPPVAWLSALKNYGGSAIIEREEHFPKQTYRNRANVYSPDGVLTLVVPVVKGSKQHTKMKDVKISYDFDWQRLHWLSLQACYRRSAYFEFYEDDLAPFFEKRFDYLFDYSDQLLRFILKAAKLNVELKYTDSYEPAYDTLTDLRATFNAKKEPDFDQKSYLQVFDERHGFLKNLSIADLLFNQGPHTTNYL